ncbi:MAG: hypothetical protein QXM16_01365 [Nitrososphaerota archaeon]
MKLLLFAKQGRLLLREFYLKSGDGEISVELVVDAPPEKVNWFVKKAGGSPLVIECRSLE